MRLIAGPGLVIAVIALIGIWLGWNYVGLMHWLGELEFRLFNRWHPAITVLALAAIPALIWRLVLMVRRRRSAATTPKVDVVRPLVYLRALRILLLSAAGIALGLALAAFVQFLMLPSADRPERPLRADQAASVEEGPVALEGLRTIGPLVRYREGILGIGPDQWFVPVAARRTALGPEYILFVEVAGRRHALVQPGHRGILRANALPRELGTLYRANGLRVSETAAVVFLNRETMRRGTLFFLFEALLGAALALVFAWFARRRITRLESEASGKPADQPAPR
ncbi:hypothetical protein J4558_02715 [Leptolyngbya sp. 15MV]|nr:hypothetical protein J4558_02715 [Leptolyngbya sp. 15MV]